MTTSTLLERYELSPSESMKWESFSRSHVAADATLRSIESYQLDEPRLITGRSGTALDWFDQGSSREPVESSVVTIGPAGSSVATIGPAGSGVATIGPAESSVATIGYAGTGTGDDLALRRYEPPAPVLVRSEKFALPSLTALQEWEGYVVAVEDDHFVANLVDVAAERSTSNEQATIPLKELSDEDIAKLEPGRIFRWAIGYLTTRAGVKIRASQFVLRDLPRWTASDHRYADEHAHDLENLLNRDGSAGKAEQSK